MVGVTPARLREIRAGRAVARGAMAHAGIKPGPITSGACGEPIWPKGVCGSVSHTARYAAAVVARSGSCDSLGIDLDDDRELGEAAAREIALAEELELLSASEFSATYPHARAENLLFCAKEAIFKCQFSITRFSDLDFLDVALVRSPRGGYFGLRLANHISKELAPVLSRIVTKFYCFQRVILACAFARLDSEQWFENRT